MNFSAAIGSILSRSVKSQFRSIDWRERDSNNGARCFLDFLNLKLMLNNKVDRRVSLGQRMKHEAFSCRGGGGGGVLSSIISGSWAQLLIPTFN